MVSPQIGTWANISPDTGGRGRQATWARLAVPAALANLTPRGKQR
jgi:hypothetical protein